MRHFARFIDLAVFDPKHMVCTRERLLARILMDLGATVLLWVVKQAVGL